MLLTSQYQLKKKVMVREVEDSNFECLNCDAEVRFQVDFYKRNIFQETKILQKRKVIGAYCLLYRTLKTIRTLLATNMQY